MNECQFRGRHTRPPNTPEGSYFCTECGSHVRPDDPSELETIRAKPGHYEPATRMSETAKAPKLPPFLRRFHWPRIAVMLALIAFWAIVGRAIYLYATS